MKLKPTINKGIVLMHEDGSFEMAPFQIFSTQYHTIIRIGNNALFFDAEGNFDGSEGKVPKGCMNNHSEEEILKAYQHQVDNDGKAPEEPYFASQSNAWECEVKAWVHTRDDDEKGKTITVHRVIGDKRKPN